MRTARSLTVSRRILRTPPATTHAPPPQPCMPPTTTPPATMHAPQPCTPQQPHTPPPWTEWHTCKNITLPQTSFAGGNKTPRVSYSRHLSIQ